MCARRFCVSGEVIADKRCLRYFKTYDKMGVEAKTRLLGIFEHPCQIPIQRELAGVAEMLRVGPLRLYVSVGLSIR